MSPQRSLLIASSILGIFMLTLSNSECPTDAKTPQNNLRKVLHRKKRHLVFPKSTNFVLTLTGLKAIQVKEPPNWNLDLEFDMIWPIPQEETNKNKVEKMRNKKKPMMRQKYYKLRRHKRDFYDTFRMALDRLGLPGKNCVLKTICEAKTFLHPPGISFVHDLLRVILRHEEDIQYPDSYDFAYKTEEECHRIYNCPLSILEFFLNSQ